MYLLKFPKTLIFKRRLLLILSIFVLQFTSSSIAQTREVSVPFDDGFIGAIGQNAQSANNIQRFSTLTIARAYFVQNTTSGSFEKPAGLQGNDIPGTIRLQLNNGKKIDLPGSLGWRITTNGDVQVLGFSADPTVSVNLNTYGGPNYTIQGGTDTGDSNFGFKLNSSTYTLPATGGSLSGNAANNLLDLLNSYLDALPRVLAPSSRSFDLSTTNQDPGDFSLVGFPNTILLCSIGLVNPPAGTTFSLSSTTNLTRSTGYNSWTNLTRISFTGTQAAINTALASMSVSTGAAAGNINISVSATVNNANYYFNPINGHYYMPVSTGAYYNTAKTLASQQTFKGQTGYLVTLTSANEESFLLNNVPQNDIWIALSDAAQEGFWRIDAGPENGTLIKTQNGQTAGNVSGQYNNWCGGEPNDASNEDYAVTKWSGGTCWNDLNPNYSNPYVVEFGTWTNPDDQAFTDFYNASTTYTANCSAGQTPVAPTVVSQGTRTGAGTVNLVVSVPAGTTADWYATETGGTVLSGGSGVTTFTTPVIASTTNYYVQTRNNSSGCLSTTRTLVTATVLPCPTATPTVQFRLSPPSITYSAIQGQTGSRTENFNSLTTGALPSSGSFAVGSFTKTGTASINSDVYYGARQADGTGFTKYLGISSSAVVSVTLTDPSRYVGFWWGGGDSGNRVTIYGSCGGNEIQLAQFTTSTITTLLQNPTVTAVNGISYSSSAYNGINYNGISNEPFAYINLQLDNPDIYFTRLEFTQTTGGGFEIDNITTSTGYGAATATTPSAPTITSVSVANGSATVNFTAPSSNGGSPITNYEYSIDGGATWTTLSPAVTTSPVVIPGVTGTNYTIVLRAVNSIGSGATSNAATPPIITGPNGSGTTTASTAAKSFLENSTAVVHTFTANKSVTWSLDGGEDADKFSINATTGALTFQSAPDFDNPTDGSTSGTNTYIVIIKATDALGLTKTQTLTVSVLKDSDGDGIADDTDPDDDGDGILDTDELDCSASTVVSQTLNPSPFYFVQWNSLSNTGVLTGTINVGGTIVNVTVTNSAGSIELANDTPYGGTSDWAPQPSGSPNTSTFRSVTLGEHKFVFDKPVNNPRFFINSLNKTLDLSLPGKILKSNDKFTGTPTGSTTSVLVGNEANGTISFTGNVTEVSFTGRNYEFYCNFSLGVAALADYSSCVDKDTDGDGIVDRLDLDSDGDGVTDAQEKADGTSPVLNCSFVLASQTLTPDAAWNTADCDGDGANNLTEKNRGSDPLVADLAPVITGPNGNSTTTAATSAKSFPENSTAVVYTFTANKSVTWSLDGGEDAAKFTINTNTGALTFQSAPDFENPTDGTTSGTNTYIVIIKATDTFGLTKTQTLTVTVTDVVENVAPTNITLSATSIAENNAANATVGTLSSTDPDAGDTHTYSLVSGTGSTDNAAFNISGNSLRATAALDFETKSSYSIRIRTTDAGGLSFEKVFTVTVTNVNETPTDIALSASSIAENNAANATVGTLSSTDPDAGDTHTYSLVSGTGSTDNAAFNISGNSLRATSALDFETKSSYSIRIRTTDAGGLSFEKVFTVTVSNQNEAPTNITSSQTAIYEGNATGATVGNLSSTDPDAGDTHTYALVSGTGSTDNASFSISGNQLKAAAVLDFKTKNSYSIRIRTTDAGGLTFEKVFTITVLQSPFATGTGNLPGSQQITAASNDVTISKGYSSQLDVTGSGLVSYSWSPSIGLSATNIANPIASPSVTTTYAVTVTNNLGLSTVVYVTVNVIEDYNLTPNNVITPNGDGVNDTWVIGNLNTYPDNEVQIFDKAGRILYQVKGYQNNWDGTLNGFFLNEGTYFYVIKIGSKGFMKKGYINIIRE